MRIKKIAETTPITGNVIDGYSESTADGYSCNYINELNTYSTDGQRIGTWIDGKPIYRKVLNFTTGAQYDNMSKTLINFPNVKMVLKYYGQIQCSDVPRALPHKQSSILIIDATQIRFDIDGDTSGVSGGRTCHLVLEYTKTTD